MKTKSGINITINNVPDEMIREARLLLLENRPVPNTYELYQDYEDMPEIIKFRILEYFYEAYELYEEWSEELDDICEMSYYDKPMEETFIWEIMQYFYCTHIQADVDAIKTSWFVSGENDAISTIDHRFRNLDHDRIRLKTLRFDTYYDHHNSNGFVKDAIRQLVWLERCIEGNEHKYPEVNEAKRQLKLVVNCVGDIDIDCRDGGRRKEMIFDVYALAFAAGMRYHDYKRSTSKERNEQNE